MAPDGVEPFSTMPEFDPERYLRRMGEREVVRADDDHRGQSVSYLPAATTALVSCGLLAAERAVPLLSGYAAALTLRAHPFRRGQPPEFARDTGTAEVTPLAPKAGSSEAVLVEALHPENPAIAWLWQTLADFSDVTGRSSGLPAALFALQAAGLIPASDPELDALMWVRDRAVAPEERRTRADAPPPGVPQEWLGFRTGRTGAFTGPERRIAVGAATPVFGGVSLAIHTLTSDRFGFSLEAEGRGLTLADGGPVVLARNPLALWARDDNANVYLGHASGWSRTPDKLAHSRGSVAFAALDPSATELSVIAQTRWARASIRIAL